MKKYVIIGNGAAAVNCIEGIRSTDEFGEIVVISEEKHKVYCRPLISYYLEGKTDLSHMGYRGEDFYEKMQCRVLYGRKAIAILPESREVKLDDGTVVAYTDLCLATGSSPFIPPFEGLSSVKKQYTFMTLDDAFGLERGICQSDHVLIIGAGLIGLKCAEGIAGRAASVTLCDLADHVLSGILDAECAAMIRAHLEDHGFHFYLNDGVARFKKNTAYLKSGAAITFDALVLACGISPNTSLFQDIGGEVSHGIVVDDRMRTSVENIYAAGDCAEGADISTGRKRILAMMPNACMQGHTAGVNMAGGNKVFDKALPMNAVGFFGLHVMTAGSYEGELYEEKTEKTMKRLFTEDDLLKGFILIGSDERAGIYTSMIREQTPLSSIHFDLLKKTATTAAFPAETRRKKFGGVV